MAKTNYSFEKRQRDIAKKQKKEEKRQRKTGNQSDQITEDSKPAPVDQKTVP